MRDSSPFILYLKKAVAILPYKGQCMFLCDIGAYLIRYVRCDGHFDKGCVAN